MFVGIANSPRPYAWGSRTAIAELLGRDPSGEPEAELWLGAHAGSPSRIERPELVAGAADLAEWIGRDPHGALGRFAPGRRLPFLMKVLAAGAALSLQAHPNADQARAGFRRENAAGIPLDAPQRNYRDAFPKPELIYALSDTFDALCGFRPGAEWRAIVAELQLRADRVDSAAIDALVQRVARGESTEETFTWLTAGGPDVDALVSRVCEVAAREPVADELAIVGLLAAQHPGDAGIVVALMLNRVTLRRGEVLYLPAGNIHAYLDGLGIEVMAASDNVLRGGLTPKHVDADELRSVLDFRDGRIPLLEAETQPDGLAVYRPDVDDFVLAHYSGTGPARQSPNGPAIALCTAGEVRIAGAGIGTGADSGVGAGSVDLTRGDSVFITPDEGDLTLSGPGELFITTPGRSVARPVSRQRR